MNDNPQDQKDNQVFISEKPDSLDSKDDTEDPHHGTKSPDFTHLPSTTFRETLKESPKKILMFELITRRASKLLASYFEINSVTCILREKWVFLLSVFVCSKAALEITETKKLVQTLLVVSYLCLGYQIIENIFRYRFLKARNFGAQKLKCLFDIADKALVALFISILSLQYSQLINKWFLILPPILSLFQIFLYNEYCKVSQLQDDIKIATRVVFLLQSLMIAGHMANLVNSDWKTTLIFLWIYFGIGALYAVFAASLVLALFLVAIVSYDIRTLCFLRSQILGYIWHISYSLLSAVGLVIFTGVFIKIGSNEDDVIQIGLLYAKRLSLFLMVYSGLLFPLLKKINMSFLQSLGMSCRNRVDPQKKYKVQETGNKKKRAFFSMISSTYFSLLEDVSEEIGQKTEGECLETPSENMCYICEDNGSNAILVECGHGGICCECAKQIVEQRSLCMECRKPVKAIYKIENSSNLVGKRIQAHELIEIVEI